MSDQDFNFAPPPAKRDRPKPFEPPPWEREQFDELERQKQHGAVAEVAAAERVEPEQESPAPEVPKREPSEAGGAPRDSDGERPQRTGPSEESIAAMLVQLKGEEPPVIAGVWQVSLAASFVVAVIGLALSVVGVVALGKQYGAVGSFGGFVLLLFGIGFIGAGIWVAYQTLRQRGVL